MIMGSHAFEKRDPMIHDDVAIIGMACVFPKAPNLQTYWENILSKVDAIDDPPEDRRMDEFFDPRPEEKYKTYCKRGGYLYELPKFNPFDFGIMPVAIDGAEPEHFLALQVAHDALVDSGFPEKPLNRERTEVILGRGTYVSRGLVTVLHHGISIPETLRVLRELHPEYSVKELEAIEQRLRSSVPPFNSETAPGLVPNIMAALIANRLDLRGSNFVVDAACASALVATEIGIRNLLDGKCDSVLIGAVQTSAAAFMNILFARLGAVSHLSQLMPFSADADGTMLGEGVGMMVLKRTEDAEKDGHRIYATIKGLGSSSDGRAKGILAPRVEGEELALRRAYDTAGIHPDTIGLIEAHGTGIPLGDVTEIQALTRLFGSRDGGPPRCALGSVKSMIGHLLPAAGIAGMIKTALALYHKTLPPTLHCNQPNPNLEIGKTPFYLNTEIRPWIHGKSDAPRRAGVNAFGFGGINTHAIMEEYDRGKESAIESLCRHWDTELCVLQADSREGLVGQCRQLMGYLSTYPEASLLDVAYTLNVNPFEQPCRLAIISSSADDLRKKLTHAMERLEDPKRSRIKDKSGIYFFEEPLAREGRLAFLFPGEGSQYSNMLSDLCIHFSEVRSCFDTLDRAFGDHLRESLPSHFIFPLGKEQGQGSLGEEELWQMDYAVDAVLTADRAIFELFNRLEICPHVIVGHSSGEIMALEAAGAIELSGEAERIQHILAGNEMIQGFFAEDAIPEALLIAVGGADRNKISEVIRESDGKVFIAMNNCPHQVVICCGKDSLDRVTDRLRGAGGIYQVLPFARPYHTPLFEPGRKSLERFFGRVDISAPKVEMYSCMTAGPMPYDSAEVRKLAVGQWAALVRFQETIESMYEAGVRLFVEIGPRGNLTGFVSDTLKGKPHLAVASNVHHRSGITQLNHSLGLLAAHGVPMRLEPLYNRRAPRTLDLENPGKDQSKYGEKKGAIQLTIGLPVPSLEGLKSEKHMPQSCQDVLGPVIQEDSFPPMFEPVRTPNQNIDSQIPCTAVQGAPQFPFENLSMHTLSPSCVPQIMKEHFKTMEQFLATQEEVMTTYLTKTGSSPDLPERNSDPVQFLPSSCEQSSESADITETLIHTDKELQSLIETKSVPTQSTPLVESSLPSSDTIPHSKKSVEKLLLSLVSERTGYPTNMLKLDQNLEADLGIDSIKRVEILGAMSKHLGVLEESQTEQLSRLKTLGEIIDYLTGNFGKGDSPQNSLTAEAGVENRNPARSIASTDTAGILSMPFSGKILELLPGKEITVVRQLNIAEDIYLQHHTFGGNVSQFDPNLLGLPVLPFTMGMEMMAETAAQLFPDSILVGMKNITAHNWVILEQQQLTLEINARVKPGSSQANVQIRIIDSDSSKTETRIAVEGIMIFGYTYPEVLPAGDFHLSSECSSVITPEQFYPYAMFHGPSFQSVSTLNRCGDNGVEAALKTPPRNHLFRTIPDPQLLSDPVLLDGAGQAVGLWAANYLDTNFVVFPVGLGEVRFYSAPSQKPISMTCRVNTALKGNTYIRSDIELLNTDGSLGIQIIDLQHKRINMPESIHLFRGSREVMLSTPWKAPIDPFASSETMTCRRFNPMDMDFSGADGQVLRTVVAYIVLSRRERDVWATLSGPEKRRTEWLLARVAGKEAVRALLKQRSNTDVWPADIDIQADEHGKPMVSGQWMGQTGWAPSISLTHSRGMAAAFAAYGGKNLGIGIDIEHLGPKSEGFEKLAFSPEENKLIAAQGISGSPEWTLRAWCAKEAVAKALGRGLSGGPRDLITYELDRSMGTVSLEISGSLSREFSKLNNKYLIAYTLCEDDLIAATSAHTDGGFDE
ncbi:MAG: polyketide synthase dehydratase domain-containing protein [Deltaproteobacteria bacterium]|nr:polyketide synthase dehydratase domain-containing protein [Deltaproteobacteria bacterium]